MKVTHQTIDRLGELLKEHQEAKIIALLAGHYKVDAGQAMNLYYSSDIAKYIDEGCYGIQYLAPEYLAEEIVRSNQRTK